MENKNLIKETINENITDDSIILNNLKSNKKKNLFKITAIASSILIFIIIGITLNKPSSINPSRGPLREYRLTNEEAIEEVYTKLEYKLNSFAETQKFDIINTNGRTNNEIMYNYLDNEGTENETWVIRITNIIVNIEYKGINQSVVFEIYSNFSNVYADDDSTTLIVYNEIDEEDEIMANYFGYFNRIETDIAKIGVFADKICFANK